jgi:hypothetical protein
VRLAGRNAIDQLRVACCVLQTKFFVMSLISAGSHRNVHPITIRKKRREHAISLSRFVSIPLQAFGRMHAKLYMSGVPIAM